MIQSDHSNHLSKVGDDLSMNTFIEFIRAEAEEAELKAKRLRDMADSIEATLMSGAARPRENTTNSGETRKSVSKAAQTENRIYEASAKVDHVLGQDKNTGTHKRVRFPSNDYDKEIGHNDFRYDDVINELQNFEDEDDEESLRNMYSFFDET